MTIKQWSIQEKIVWACLGLLTASLTAATGKLIALGEKQAAIVARVDSIERTMEKVEQYLTRTIPSIDSLNEKAESILQYLRRHDRKEQTP